MAVFTGTQTANVYRTSTDDLGSGGEAVVRTVIGAPNLVLKLYKHPTDLRRRKVESLARRLPNPNAQARFAWPLETVNDSNGQFAGFVMRRLPATCEPLYKLYETQGAAGLGLTARDQMRIALSLAEGYAEAHRLGVVVGDANDENAVVDLATKHVLLLDCDGYVFGPWPGTGWSPDGSAPETHRSVRAKAGFYYDEYTDRFTLADHVFRLLMDGRGPFVCRTTDGSTNRPTTAEAIEGGLFIYDLPATCAARYPHIAVPLGAPSYQHLPASVRALFTRAFTQAPDQRPSALEWCRTLGPLCIQTTTPRPHTMPPTKAKGFKSAVPTKHPTKAKPNQQSRRKLSRPARVAALFLVAALVLAGASNGCEYEPREELSPGWIVVPQSS